MMGPTWPLSSAERCTCVVCVGVCEVCVGVFVICVECVMCGAKHMRHKYINKQYVATTHITALQLHCVYFRSSAYLPLGGVVHVHLPHSGDVVLTCVHRTSNNYTKEHKLAIGRSEWVVSPTFNTCCCCDFYCIKSMVQRPHLQ